jgi:hypothetical protein
MQISTAPVLSNTTVLNFVKKSENKMFLEYNGRGVLKITTLNCKWWETTM